jgi:hypothetical protein
MASAAGQTPSNGYAWPSTVGGRFRVRLQAPADKENQQLRSILRKLSHGLYRIEWDTEGAFLRGTGAPVSTDDQNLFDHAISRSRR